MALIKEVKTTIGVNATYWRVGLCSIDTREKEACFSVKGYVVKGAETPIDEYNVTDLMGLEDKALYEEYFGVGNRNFKDWQTACYEYAKAHVPFFDGAVDDEDEQEYQNELLKQK